MSSARKEWTDAEWAARCRAGETEALARLAAVFVPALYRDVKRCWRLHGPPKTEEIRDAVQDLFADLLKRPEELLGAFRPGPMTLEEYLTRLARQRAEGLCRKELCRHRHEASVAEDGEATRRRVEIGVEERAGRLSPRLSPGEREVLEWALERTLAEHAGTLSPEALRQIVHRIREKRCQQDADDAAGAAEEKT